MITLTEQELLAWISGFVWPFFRTLAIFQSMPVFSHKAVPARFKVMLAAVIALAIQPYIFIPNTIELFSLQGMLTIVQQVVVGLSIGLGFRVIFAIFDFAGAIIGMKMGLGFASFVDPMNNAPSAIFGTILTLAASVVFLAAHGHHTVILFLIESFQIIPIGTSFMDAIDWIALADLASITFSVGLQLALPLVGAILAINTGIGFLARSAPQLHIIQISFAITIGVGLFLVWAILPLMADAMVNLASFRIPYNKVPLPLP